MESIKVDIDSVKSNPKNPRTIKDHQFKKLVQSIKDFPEMIQFRPIVVDEHNIILGGNMRFRASLEAGLKEIYIMRADNWSEEQKNEFIIKDNASFGDWDWDVLANRFNDTSLNTWGLSVWSSEIDFGNNEPIDEPEEQEAGEKVDVHSEPKAADFKVIQLEFDVTDYDYAVELVTFIRNNNLSIGDALINAMNKSLNDASKKG